MEEVWKDIINYEGLYQVSNLGNVRRLTNTGIKMLKPSNRQYQDVDLSKHGEHKRQAIHRLVALHFVPNADPKNKLEVNHIDGNKKNNNANNLEWVTTEENSLHSQNVLKNYSFGKPPIKVVKIDIQTNEEIEIYPSIMSAARDIGKVSAGVGIRNCCRGMQLSAYGYKWMYENERTRKAS